MSHFTNDPDPLGHTQDDHADDEGACPNCDGTGIDPDSLGTCPACHDRPGEWVQVGVASHASPGYTEAAFSAADVPAGTALYTRGVQATTPITSVAEFCAEAKRTGLTAAALAEALSKRPEFADCLPNAGVKEDGRG